MYHYSEEDNEPDFWRCDDCWEAERVRVPMKERVKERDLCEDCYDRVPKCVGCGLVGIDEDERLCAECKLFEEKERDCEALFFGDEHLQNVEFFWLKHLQNADKTVGIQEDKK